jgi:cystathionine beta-synthase
LNIIEQAEKRGELKSGGTIVEATSGNTGVGLAIAAALKGYKTIFVMPDKMSNEKIQLLRAYGAKWSSRPPLWRPKTRARITKSPNALRVKPRMPFSPISITTPTTPPPTSSTGPEIWEQTEGRVTDVIIGMGTGGTISGIGRYLKGKNPDVQIVGVDIEGSILLEIWQSGGKIPRARIQKPTK